ncbi:hypothetical protein [Egicoccus sp. AB-alg2]|uniref:hypothetical protein n=1 Tax=Egicoccus sp. AB-alg2 TaxID=3242693 RepID=UPI00359E798A
MRLRNTTAAAAVAVLLAACGGAADETDPGAAPETTDEPTTDDPAEAPGEPELPDAEEFITDGEFRGQGVVLPVPDGWSVDEFGLLQGIVVATSDEDQSQQLAAQAVDASGLEEEQQIDFDELLELQRTQFQEVDPEIEPTIDEEVEVGGAERAQRLRFESVEVEEQPAFTLDLVLADDGQGTIALFNYAAPSEAFDEEVADLLVTGAGIDPDSEPPSPEPMAPEEGLGGEEGATGDGATGDGATGDGATGDGATGDDATGDDTAGDDAAGDDATGDDAADDQG